jgi:hypothetical protein
MSGNRKPLAAVENGVPTEGGPASEQVIRGLLATHGGVVVEKAEDASPKIPIPTTPPTPESRKLEKRLSNMFDRNSRPISVYRNENSRWEQSHTRLQRAEALAI